MDYRILSIEDKDHNSVLIYVSKVGNYNTRTRETFHVQRNGDLHNEALKAMQNSENWDVDMKRFTTRESTPYQHEELVDINFEDIFNRAIRTAVKARMSDVNSIFADSVTDQELLNQVKGSLGGNILVYEAHVSTLRSGYVFKNHRIYPLYAYDDEDAFKVMLSVLQQREGRDITEKDLLNCVIVSHKTGEVVMNKTYLNHLL